MIATFNTLLSSELSVEGDRLSSPGKELYHGSVYQGCVQNKGSTDSKFEEQETLSSITE